MEEKWRRNGGVEVVKWKTMFVPPPPMHFTAVSSSSTLSSLFLLILYLPHGTIPLVYFVTNRHTSCLVISIKVKLIWLWYHQHNCNLWNSKSPTAIGAVIINISNHYIYLDHQTKGCNWCNWCSYQHHQHHEHHQTKGCNWCSYHQHQDH